MQYVTTLTKSFRTIKINIPIASPTREDKMDVECEHRLAAAMPSCTARESCFFSGGEV
jgi:hypothetical protein